MTAWERPLDTRRLFDGTLQHLVDPDRLRRWLEGLQPRPSGLKVADAQPANAYPGSALVVAGSGFDTTRANNVVEVGGKPALVVEADEHRLLVLTDMTCGSGPITVTTGGSTAIAPDDFVARPWPLPGSKDDAPPYSFDGHGPSGEPMSGDGSAGTIPPTGTAKVLVVLTYPTDLVPADMAGEKATIQSTFANVTTFYDQVSYGDLTVDVDVTDFVALLDNADYYHRPNGAPGYPNIDWAVHDQLSAEAAQGAVDQGFDLDDYRVMAILVHMPGLSVRAWGGWSAQDFAFNDGAGTAIHVVAANPLSMIIARHDADWGRAAHEFGHNLLDGGVVLGEDIYASDLVDPSDASAQQFDLMGNHDSHPMFTGFWMHQVGWFDHSGVPANIFEKQWDRNPFQQEIELVAHGATRDTNSNRFNLVRITVSPGLDYYVEVRQQPPSGSPQVYDANIPLPAGTSRHGGVVVTKAISGQVDNNQEMRLISLLHDEHVLLAGDEAIDPARDFKVTVVDDQVSTNPLVCRVRVEWAQQIGDTPGGDFDLTITPWNAKYESPDIWVDRNPFGTFDTTDPAGNPTGNGDEPRVGEINHFFGQLHNTGIAVSNVRMTFYVIHPPGVGDNGTWTPIATKTIATVPANNKASTFTNWTPTVGEHTCLKVFVEQQLGEITGGNNSAQENVFSFQPAAHSVPEPVSMPVAVRNPRDVDVVVQLRLVGVPEGYRAYLPHRWVHLGPHEEQQMDLLVVPTFELEELREAMTLSRRRHEQKKDFDSAPHIRVFGQIERGYLQAVPSEVPGSWYADIGGITARVEPKQMAAVKLAQEREAPKDRIRLVGEVAPSRPGQSLRVDLRADDGSVSYAMATTDSSGVFRCEFDLSQLKPAKPIGRTTLPTGRPARLERRFRAQAHILNARDLAPADSNVVQIVRVR